jgi:phosphoglycolate phosphatase-like HAD superfamily hydrolase
MIGDSQYDMIAAQKAGCGRVGVCTGSTTTAIFQKLNVSLILEKVADLLSLLPLESNLINKMH